MRSLRKPNLWVLAGFLIGLLALSLLGGGARARERTPLSDAIISGANMESDNFRLNWNVAANGGGTISSANFIVSSTIGQTAVGTTGSANFAVCSGYWCWPGLFPSPAEPDITVSPSALDFGDQDVNAGPSASQMVTISNDGGAGLQISSVDLAGTNPGQFTIQSDSGEGDLGPGATRSLQIAFNPSSQGAKSAILRIVFDDPDEATVDVALSGTGTGQGGSGGLSIFLPLLFKDH